MEKVNQIFLSSKILILLVILVSTPALLSFFHNGYFPAHDYIHIVRIYEMTKSLKDGQFPVRWVPDLRYGEPLFNFYAPLPYYLGALVHRTHISYLATAKVLFGLSLILSGLGMFFLGRELFGNLGGLLSSALYIYAPYHSVDIYVRGALSEAWSLVFFPLIFLFSFKLSQKKNLFNLIFLSISLTSLYYTHNIMAMLFLPFFMGLIFFLIWQKKDLKLILWFSLSLVISFGLAASYLLPAYFEKDLIQTTQLTSNYFDFRAHFVEIHQFFSSFWGYGASVWGPNDGLSFQIGAVHWVLLGISLIILWLKRTNKKIFFLLIFLTLEFLLSLFMQHNKSTPIWLAFPVLAFTQFPWRFLGVSIFLVSLVAGVLGFEANKDYVLAFLVMVVVIVVYNLQFFHPQEYYFKKNDEDYISPSYLFYEGFIPKDYLPVYVKSIITKRIDSPHALKGEISIGNFRKNSNSGSFDVNVKKNADMEAPITYFPGWIVYINKKLIPQEQPTDLGLIHFKLPQGIYRVELNFKNTLIRSLGDIISLISGTLILILVLAAISKRRLGKYLPL